MCKLPAEHGPRAPMNLTATLALLAFGIVLVAAMMWRERRPRKGLSPPLLPTLPFLFLGIIIALAAAIHLLSFLH